MGPLFGIGHACRIRNYFNSFRDFVSRSLGLSITPIGNSLNSLTRVNPLSNRTSGAQSSASEARTFLKQYVETFFPVVFTDRPRAVRLFHELLHKHRYLSMFAGENGYDKFVKSLETLTILCSYMFLTAMLYDAEWPNDNGQCSLLHTEDACIRKRSSFSRSDSLCKWLASNIFQSAEAKDTVSSTVGKCIWVNPSVSPAAQIIITVLVVGFSGPINILVSCLVYFILLTPSAQDFEEKHRVISDRRGSVMLSLGTDLEANLREKHNSEARLNNNEVPSFHGNRKLAHSISMPRIPTLIRVHDSLKDYCARYNQLEDFRLSLTTRPRPTLQTETAGIGQSIQDRENHYFSSVDPLITGLCDNSHRLKGTAKALYHSQWDRICGSRQFADSYLLPLRAELLDVNRVSARIIKELEGKPSKVIGISILELFVLDLLGRESSQAKIFRNQRVSYADRLVVSYGWKAFAIAVILCLNGYFVFMCMLYANGKGRDWQRNWVLSCGVYLIVDVFVKHVNLVFVVHYYIPELIATHTHLMKQQLRKAVNELVTTCVRQRKQMPDTSTSLGITTMKAMSSRRRDYLQEEFSITDFLFVSSHVARAYPDLLESSIVQSCRSLIVSSDQSKKWTDISGEALDDNDDYRKNTNASLSFSSMSSVGQNTMKTVVSCLITLGCQHIFMQYIVVQTIDPIFVGFMAYLGSLIFHDSAIGLMLLVGIMVTLLIVAGYFNRQFKHHRAIVEKISPLLIDLESGQSKRANRVRMPTSKEGDCDKDHDDDDYVDDKSDSDEVIREYTRSAKVKVELVPLNSGVVDIIAEPSYDQVVSKVSNSNDVVDSISSDLGINVPGKEGGVRSLSDEISISNLSLNPDIPTKVNEVSSRDSDSPLVWSEKSSSLDDSSANTSKPQSLQLQDDDSRSYASQNSLVDKALLVANISSDKSVSSNSDQSSEDESWQWSRSEADDDSDSFEDSDEEV